MSDTDKVMFCHTAGSGDWCEYTVATADRMVSEGKWKECECCEAEGQYDDGLPTYHCTFPCPECDEVIES